MSRYISVKWLEDNAKEYSLGYYEEDEWATPLNVLDSAPSIDIVRCKECKWWIVAMDENNSDEDYLKCNMDKWPDADDYCSYGERKGE